MTVSTKETQLLQAQLMVASSSRRHLYILFYTISCTFKDCWNQLQYIHLVINFFFSKYSYEISDIVLLVWFFQIFNLINCISFLENFFFINPEKVVIARVGAYFLYHEFLSIYLLALHLTLFQMLFMSLFCWLLCSHYDKKKIKL